VPTLAPQFQHHLDGEDYDDEEEEGVLDREGSTIDDDNDDDGLVIVESQDENEEEDQDEENAADLVSVTKLINSATNQSFQKYFELTGEEENGIKDKEFLENITSSANPLERKKSAYSAAPHKIPCPYCPRKFPWTSSLNRHILTHTGQKPYKCRECPLWFTTKSNCDRHVIRKHGGTVASLNNNNDQSFTARNVPDRPYKCQLCPSSTFSSKSNLKKHQYTRHPEGILEMSSEGGGGGGGSSADDEEEDIDCDEDTMGNNHEIDESVLKGQARFRCHVCQHPVQVFCDRKTALNHLKVKHIQEYEILFQNGDVTRCESLNDNAEDELSSSPSKSISCLFCSTHHSSAEALRIHMASGHNKYEANSPTSTKSVVNLSAQEKSDSLLKKKRATLMDKINQLSANASSVQSEIFKHNEVEEILVE